MKIKTKREITIKATYSLIVILTIIIILTSTNMTLASTLTNTAHEQRTGDILLPYSKMMILTNIKIFYDEIQDFSNKVLQECGIKAYEEKATCAYTEAQKYENTKISPCSAGFVFPINLSTVQVENKVEIKGILKSVDDIPKNSEEQTVQPVETAEGSGSETETEKIKFEIRNEQFTQPASTIQTPTNYKQDLHEQEIKVIEKATEGLEAIEFEIDQSFNYGETIKLRMNVKEEALLNTILVQITQEKIGRTIHLKNVSIKEKKADLLIIEINNLDDIEYVDEKEVKLQENLYAIALETADCGTHQNNCLCKINIHDLDEEIILKSNEIITTTETIKTNTLFIRQNTGITTSISPILLGANFEGGFGEAHTRRILRELHKISIKDKENILFKKTNQGLIYVTSNNEQELENCVPTKRHLVFCAEPKITEESTYFEKNFYPRMNFALKI